METTTGLQPVSRPVEQIVGFFHKDLKKVQKTVQIFHFNYIYRQSPVKSPDIKNIIVVTLTFLFESSPLR